MSDQLFIGIDSGTQGTKGVVFSRDDGRIQAEAYTDHQLIENIGGRREQKPEWWLEACSNVIEHAYQRQKYICQAQSVNLFFEPPPATAPQELHDDGRV